jgi:S1-C subfamily serine protease
MKYYLLLSVSALAAVLAVSCGSDTTEGSLYQGVGKNTVKLLNPDNLRSGGTGFNVQGPSGQNYTMTNSHVCRMTERDYVVAQREDGSTRRLQILDIGKDVDLCVLQPFTGAQGLPLAERAGYHEDIYVIGHPKLMPVRIAHGYNMGEAVISVVDTAQPPECIQVGGEPIQTPFGFSVCVRSYLSVLTDVQTFPGNSGSAAVNARGELVGVLFAGDQETNFGVLVPLSEIKRFMLGR